MSQLERILSGLQLLARLGATDIGAQHDILYVGHVDESSPTTIERKQLDDWGWCWDDELESWSHFV